MWRVPTNGYMNEEVYAAQPKGFEDPLYPDQVYKLMKVLYGLKQAPWTWYDRRTTFFVNNDYERGKVDATLLWNM